MDIWTDFQIWIDLQIFPTHLVGCRYPNGCCSQTGWVFLKGYQAQLLPKKQQHCGSDEEIKGNKKYHPSISESTNDLLVGVGSLLSQESAWKGSYHFKICQPDEHLVHYNDLIRFRFCILTPFCLEKNILKTSSNVSKIYSPLYSILRNRSTGSPTKTNGANPGKLTSTMYLVHQASKESLCEAR